MKALSILIFALCLAFVDSAKAGLEETIDFGDVCAEGFGAPDKYTKYWKCGTGFFLTKDGYLVTDALAVKDAENIIVVWQGKAIEASLASLSTTKRVAVLKAKGDKFEPVAMAQTDFLAKGVKVKAIGCSVSDEEGIGLSASDCIVSEKSKRNTKVFGTLAASMAGCPIVDNTGSAVGMLLSSGGDKQVECSVVDSPSLLSLLPSAVKKKVNYRYKASVGNDNLTLQTGKSIVLVLAYNDERRKAELAKIAQLKEEEKPYEGELTVERLRMLAKSAKTRKTHLECTGSGFIIAEDGYVLTNHHVVDGARDIMIVYKGKPYRTSLRAQSKDKDLALLKIEGDEKGPFTPVSVSANAECAVGQTIFTVGYPRIYDQGLEVKITKGIISSRSGFHGERSEYQMDAAIQGGNSGGPIADETGNVVGVCVASLRNGQNVNYAIKWSTVESFLPKGVAVRKHAQKEGLCFPEAVARVVDSSVLVLNFSEGGPSMAYSSLAPDRRREAESFIRKLVLYARLAKLKKEWKEVKKLTDQVLSIDANVEEAKKLNDLACEELGLHLVVVAVVEGRDVPAKIEPISGFKDSWLLCGEPLALSQGLIEGHIVWKEDGEIWQGDIECYHNWKGTKEIKVQLSRAQ